MNLSILLESGPSMSISYCLLIVVVDVVGTVDMTGTLGSRKMDEVGTTVVERVGTKLEVDVNVEVEVLVEIVGLGAIMSKLGVDGLGTIISKLEDDVLLLTVVVVLLFINWNHPAGNVGTRGSSGSTLGGGGGGVGVG